MTDVADPTRSVSSSSAADPASTDGAWPDVCPAERVRPDRGVAALVADGDDQVPVAVFRLSAPSEADAPDGADTPDGDESADEWYAVSHLDPATGAPVMARGLVGSVDEPTSIPTVAAPLHKHRYDLRTGRCLDDEQLRLRVFEIRVVDAVVQVRPTPAAPADPSAEPR
jgi:nitrite reductase (NADH) small subunit